MSQKAVSTTHHFRSSCFEYIRRNCACPKQSQKTCVLTLFVLDTRKATRRRTRYALRAGAFEYIKKQGICSERKRDIYTLLVGMLCTLYRAQCRHTNRANKHKTLLYALCIVQNAQQGRGQTLPELLSIMRISKCRDFCGRAEDKHKAVCCVLEGTRQGKLGLGFRREKADIRHPRLLLSSRKQNRRQRQFRYCSWMPIDWNIFEAIE